MLLCAAVLAASTCSWVYLGGVALGRPWLVVGARCLSSRILPSAAVLFFLLAHAASEELCAAGATGALGEHVAIWEGERGAADALVGSTPAALFLLLLVQTLVQLLPADVASGDDGSVMPMVAVHVLGAAFYAAQARREHCSLVVRWDRRARIVPLHYALWAASISCQIVTLATLALRLRRTADRRGRGGTVDAGMGASPAAAHRRCAAALLGTQAMLWSAGLADAYHGDLLPSIVCAVCSFASFYVLIVLGLLRPLADCRAAVVGAGGGALKYAALLRYRRTALYFAITYHLFPLIWGAANLGMLADEHARRAYTCADLLAKLLPPSVYISMIEASRRR